MRFFTLAIMGSSFLLSGCINNFAEFYQGQADARLIPTYVPSTEEVRIISTNDLAKDEKILIRQGFMPIGRSSFNANTGTVTRDSLVQHAQKIGAQVVLLKSVVTGTENRVMALNTPTTSTSYTTSNAQAYGSGGYANAYGNSTTTTYGSQTNYIPYTISRSAVGAEFFAKFKIKLGISPQDLTDDDKKDIGQNGGVKIFEIIDNSPAYFANVLPDDIVVSVNDKPVGNSADFLEKVKNLPNGTNKFEFIRNKKHMFKQIDIAP